jgi:spermidine synthase
MPPLAAWGAACFFTSGAAGLLYEVVWSKQLSYLLGNSTHAVATVVAAFLGGLALGARFLGAPLARRGRGARVYAILEIGIGALGLISLPVLRGLDPLVGELYRALGGETAGFAVARFGLLFGLLLPPAALMGATLPVLVAHFEHDLVGPALARLYALNTFGAVVGSFAGGFALMPGLGLQGTAWVAAALNLGVAMLAWTRAPAAAGLPAPASAAPPAHVPKPGAARRPAVPAPPARLSGVSRLSFAILFALSGLAALAFQIAWVRLFSLVFGSSVYSFSAVLGVYLFGLAAGSAWIARRMAHGVSLVDFARLQLGLAAVAALVLHAFARLPQWTYDLGERSGARWTQLFAGEVGLLAALLIVPCALLGAAFPLAARLLQRGDGHGDGGHAAGFAYAVNTLGTIAGSLLAGFLAIPAWGVQGTHLAALLLSFAIGLATLGIARARGAMGGRDLLWGALAAVAVGGLALSAPRWDPSLMSTGLYRPIQAANVARAASMATGGGSVVERASRQERVLFYREGVNGSVIVGTDLDGRDRWLRVSGKTDASTGDMETQVLLGLIPAALADSGARTLVIGLGSGFTAASVLAGGAGPTEVVEIEAAVVEASRFFHGAGEDPLDDPRVHLVVGDARTHLAHGGGTYGVVVSEPSNPWIAGVNNLFTVDFYRRVSARLAPGGVFCQWLQTYELSPATLSSLLASFLAVFPEGEVFAIWRASDLLLVATPPGRRLARERLETPAARRMLARAGILDPAEVTGYYAGSLVALRPAGRGAPLNRDDRPIVEYRAPRDLVAVGRTSLHGDPAAAAMVPFAEHRPEGPLFAAWTEEDWYATRVRRLAGLGDTERAGRTARGARAAGLASLAGRLDAEIETGRRRQQGLEALERARELLGVGREADGQRELERAGTIDPANGRAWLMLADRRRLAGDTLGAEAALVRGRTSDDPEIRAEAAGMTGMMELERQRPRAAVGHFREAQRLNPRLAVNYAFEARALLAAGDRAGAREAVRRGLAALPGDPGLSAMLAQLGP